MQRSLGTAKQICFSGEGRRAIWTGSATQCGESQQELFLLGVAGHAQSPAVGEPWRIKSSEKTRDSRPSLWMQTRREWAGGAEEQAFYLPRDYVIEHFLSHPEVSPSGGSKGKRNRREIHALPHVVDKGSCYTHSIKLPNFSEGVFWEDPQLLPHIYT